MTVWRRLIRWLGELRQVRRFEPDFPTREPQTWRTPGWGWMPLDEFELSTAEMVRKLPAVRNGKGVLV